MLASLGDAKLDDVGFIRSHDLAQEYTESFREDRFLLQMISPFWCSNHEDVSQIERTILAILASQMHDETLCIAASR